MKVLIVGKNSYIGNHIKNWIENKEGKDSLVFQLDAQTDEWKTFNYKDYDAIVHVAGIVHRPEIKDWKLYKSVNVDLPIEVAKLAREQGVKQFIFLSTMAVYGLKKRLSVNPITESTPISPKSMYGISKRMAEEALLKQQDDSFNVVICRPPNVYGKGCKGNYISSFVNIVKYVPIIPRTFEKVKQSMLYIENLDSFIYLAIKYNVRGIFMPQDDKAVSTIELTSSIAKALGKPLYLSFLMGYLVRILSFAPFIQKVYGGIEYDSNLSKFKEFEYNVVSFDQGIRKTIK